MSFISHHIFLLEIQQSFSQCSTCQCNFNQDLFANLSNVSAARAKPCNIAPCYSVGNAELTRVVVSQIIHNASIPNYCRDNHNVIVFVWPKIRVADLTDIAPTTLLRIVYRCPVSNVRVAVLRSIRSHKDHVTFCEKLKLTRSHDRTSLHRTYVRV